MALKQLEPKPYYRQPEVLTTMVIQCGRCYCDIISSERYIYGHGGGKKIAQSKNFHQNFSQQRASQSLTLLIG